MLVDHARNLHYVPWPIKEVPPSHRWSDPLVWRFVQDEESGEQYVEIEYLTRAHHYVLPPEQ